MQVVSQLRAQIAAGELAEGERIPSQRQMMQHWRISMQTASKVIGALKTEGLAIPSVGRDTIVAPGAAARIAGAAAGTAHAAAEPPEESGHDVKAAAAIIAAPADVAEMLGIPPGRRVLRRQEARLDDGTPVSVTVTWLPPAITAKAPRLADNKPLASGALAYIAEATGNGVVRMLEERAAMPADADTAQMLGVPQGSPVLVTRARYFGATSQIIAYAENTAPAGTWRTLSYTVTGTR
jgi:DNA-binding GntR family transcriptional regulator